MSSTVYRDEEFGGSDYGRRGRRRQKAQKPRSDVYEGSVPIARPGSNQFVAQTWRFFFYALFLAAGGASLAFLTPLPFILLPAALVTMFISLFTFLVLHYGFENYSGAFYAFLFFAATLGIVLGPHLAIIAATVPNGMFIICAAAAATAGMTFMLSAYAWTKAFFSLHRISLLGSFLSTALTGLLIIGLIALIFPTPLVMLLYGAAGVAVFSLYLVYDVYLLKIGAFKSPVEAAMNLFLDVMNLFLDILKVFIALQSEKKEIGDFSNLFWTRIVPLVGIALIVLSFGLLERWVMKDWNNIDEAELSKDDYPPSPPPSAPPAEHVADGSKSAPAFSQQGPGSVQYAAGDAQQRTQSAPPVQWPGQQGQGFNQAGQPNFWNKGQPAATPAFVPPVNDPDNQYSHQGAPQYQQPAQQGWSPSFIPGQTAAYPPVPGQDDPYGRPPAYNPNADPSKPGYSGGAPVYYYNQGAPTVGTSGNGSRYW